MPKKVPLPPNFLGGDEALRRLVGTREAARLINARVEDIDPNPYNPRQETDITELVDSMRANGFIGALDGVLRGDRVVIAYGARRLAAAKEVGISTIPVYIHDDWTDRNLLIICLVENVVREDLRPLESAQTVLRLRAELGLTQEQIAEQTGKNLSWVRDMLALALAPPELAALVREDPTRVRHVRLLAGVEDEAARAALARLVREEGLTVAQVQRAVAALKDGMPLPVVIELARQREQPAVDAGQAPGPAAAPPSAPPEARLTSGKERPAPPARTRANVVTLLRRMEAELARWPLSAVREAARDDPEGMRAALAALRRRLEDFASQLDGVDNEF
jgi:ParB family chromosome partitioning protein